MKKILITGASGFLGKNILEKFNYSKYDVWIIGRKKCFENNSNIHFVQGDLLNISDIKNLIKRIAPQILLMLAWNVGITDYWESLDNILWSTSSIETGKVFLECGGRQIIFAGTSASYNYNLGYLKERSEYENPETLYGISKLYTSKILKKLAESKGAIYCEARIFSIYGKYERQNRLIPHTIRQLNCNQVIHNTKWNLFRDYIYVEDAVNAILLLLETEKDGVFNISSGSPVCIGAIIKTIAGKMCRQNNIVFETPNTEGESRLIAGDNTKLLNCGFEIQYSLEKGIESMLKDANL